MSNLFTKDEPIEKSAAYVGYQILCIFKEANSEQLSIFEVIRKLKVYKPMSVRMVYYGIIFLYSVGLIEFDEPFLIIKNDEIK